MCDRVCNALYAIESYVQCIVCNMVMCAMRFNTIMCKQSPKVGNRFVNKELSFSFLAIYNII